MRKKVLIFTETSEGNPSEPRVFPNFKKGCEVLGLPYHYLKQTSEFPKHWRQWKVEKKEVEQ